MVVKVGTLVLVLSMLMAAPVVEVGQLLFILDLVLEVDLVVLEQLVLVVEVFLKHLYILIQVAITILQHYLVVVVNRQVIRQAVGDMEEDRLNMVAVLVQIHVEVKLEDQFMVAEAEAEVVALTALVHHKNKHILGQMEEPQEHTLVDIQLQVDLQVV
jgi:hypothetical protein